MVTSYRHVFKANSLENESRYQKVNWLHNCFLVGFEFSIMFSITIMIKVTIMLSIARTICGQTDSETLNGSFNTIDENKMDLEMENSESSTKRMNGRLLYKELVDKLFKDYSPVIPPNANDPSTTVNVSILMVLESLAYLDMKSQTLNIMAWFQIDWYDPAFSWDTDLYPVHIIVVSEKEVWRPVLAIANTLLPRDQIMKTELPISIFSNGNFRWFPGDSFIMTCHMNLNFYPFDTQMCKVSLAQWSHTSHHFNCTQAKIRSAVSGNGEWDIIDLGSYYKLLQEPDHEYWELVYTITLQRKWVFYVINLILPIILVSALNNVVFMLHVDSGDKMSVSVTSFLTIVVFLTMINDSLAKNSDTVCYLSLYLAVQVTLGALAVIQSAVVVACRHKTSPDKDCHPNKSSKEKCASTFEPLDDEELPDSYMPNKDSPPMKADNQGQLTRHQDFLFSGSNHLTPHEQTSDRTASEKTERKPRDVTDTEVIGSKTPSRDWTVTAARIDSVCFPVFVGLNVMSLLVFCIVILSA